jgi:hypothetical protein
MIEEFLPKPSNPIETGNPDKWGEIEKCCKTLLPEDYKRFINKYGSGQIGGFINIFNPFSENEFINLMEQIKVRLDAVNYIKENYGEEECPYSLFPQTNGLLPFAATDNGDVFFWKTTGVPDKWTVVLNESRGSFFEEFQHNFSEVLKNLITGKIESKIIPNDFIDNNNLFVSYE